MPSWGKNIVTNLAGLDRLADRDLRDEPVYDDGRRSSAVTALSVVQGAGPVLLTVIVPTRNERQNVPMLLSRLTEALRGLPVEFLFADDSDDDTPIVLAEAARGLAEHDLPIRLLHRVGDERTGGLGGAVVAAAREARGDWLLVMDGDLQHPPEAAASLARIAMRHDVDVVIGTRYSGNGSSEGLAGGGRVFTSSSATRLVKAVFPRRLATVSDPMSGLFAVRRSAIDLDRLDPLGFKILLEILVRNPGCRVAEVAYEMAPRQAGASKASVSEGVAFLRHLTRLRRQRLVGQLRERPARGERLRQLSRMVAFGAVGLSGVAVNTAALWFFYSVVGVHHLLAAALATQLSTGWNFAGVDGLVYRRNPAGTRRGRAIRFFAMNNLLLLARLPVLQALVLAGTPVLAGNAVTLVLLFLVRFLVSDRVIYGGNGSCPGRDPVRLLVDAVPVDVPATNPATNPAAAATDGRKRSSYLTYRYDVAGVVRIGSQILLPELEFFRSQWISDDDVDIAVRVGDVGSRVPRRRAAMTELADADAESGSAPAPVVRYEEHLGRLGANFRVRLGDTITIEVGPLLARSPHVVYTNVIEALLRFVLISRGRMLLHSACVSLDGVGVMLSALTDTGKTATVLRLLREHGGRFLSDDMTVVDAEGNAMCFPKPLTISAHTLRAVQANDLTAAEWRRLQFQSRLHSKGGRSIALTLSRFNLPIMGINAIAQILVPPPKYTVDRLVSCRMGSATKVEELFIIERGTPRIAELDRDTTLRQMLINTDDAYGFPPFRYLAPSITIAGNGYQQLREREREILTGFLAGVRTRVVASDTFGWADEIPRLLRSERPEPTTEASADGVPTRSRGRHLGQLDHWPSWGGRLVTPEGAV
jgi:glycosyltransferase involved in cell wall biosynthesis